MLNNHCSEVLNSSLVPEMDRRNSAVTRPWFGVNVTQRDGGKEISHWVYVLRILKDTAGPRTW